MVLVTAATHHCIHGDDVHGEVLVNTTVHHLVHDDGGVVRVEVLVATAVHGEIHDGDNDDVQGSVSWWCPCDMFPCSSQSHSILQP